MERPLVSVIIPVYNGEALLAETLASVIGQSWRPLEIIVVDDGSTDASISVARQFENPEVNVIAQDVNSGQNVCRNLGFSASRGEFIQFLDADDILDARKIECQIDRLRNLTPRTLATSRWARFYNDDLSTAVFAEHADYRDYDVPLEWLVQSWTGTGTMPPVSWLLPRRLVELAGPWDESLSLQDDTEFLTRVVLASESIAFCGDAKGYYRSGRPSMSARRDRKALESYHTVCRLATEALLARERTAATCHASACLWQAFSHAAYPDAIDLVRDAERRIDDLGGGSITYGTGFALGLVESWFGWKAVHWLRRMYYALRYS